MERTFANGWSRNVLALQIDAEAHARHGKAVTNFANLVWGVEHDEREFSKDSFALE